MSTGKRRTPRYRRRLTELFGIAEPGRCLIRPFRAGVNRSDKRSSGRLLNELFAIAVVVFIDGGCLLGVGVGLRLGTKRHFVLWECRLWWCGTLPLCCGYRCFVLSCW
jgi:hypothetical protein